jgi:hypothetical protein
MLWSLSVFIAIVLTTFTILEEAGQGVVRAAAFNDSFIVLRFLSGDSVDTKNI